MRATLILLGALCTFQTGFADPQGKVIVLSKRLISIARHLEDDARRIVGRVPTFRQKYAHHDTKRLLHVSQRFSQALQNTSVISGYQLRHLLYRVEDNVYRSMYSVYDLFVTGTTPLPSGACPAPGLSFGKGLGHLNDLLLDIERLVYQISTEL